MSHANSFRVAKGGACPPLKKYKINDIGKRRGMAIVIVLVFVMSLMVLGSSYIKNLSNVQPGNTRILDQIQAEFLAQGLHRIAILKFKKYPSDFYHAFIWNIEKRKGSRLQTLSPVAPDPIDSFHGPMNSILQNWNGIIGSCSIPLLSYSTTYRMISHKPYSRDGVEVYINLAVGKFSKEYKATFDVTRTRM
jgi:hypothetical protein